MQYVFTYYDNCNDIKGRCMDKLTTKEQTCIQQFYIH